MLKPVGEIHSLKKPPPNKLITKGKGHFKDTQQIPPESCLKLPPPPTNWINGNHVLPEEMQREAQSFP